MNQATHQLKGALEEGGGKIKFKHHNVPADAPRYAISVPFNREHKNFVATLVDGEVYAQPAAAASNKKALWYDCGPLVH